MKRLIVVMDSAALETVKIGKQGKHELLNCDDHHHILTKNNQNPAEYRPDICHQVLRLLELMGSLVSDDRRVVPVDAARQPAEQGRSPAGVHPHGQERPYRSQPAHPHPAHLFSLCRTHGYAESPMLSLY